MIEAMHSLGEYCLQKQGVNTNENLIEVLVNEPNKGGNYPKVYAINFDISENSITYRNISIEDANPEKKLKYLYREKGSQGAHYTPTARIAGNTDDKIKTTFDNRIQQWFKRLQKDHPQWVASSPFFRDLCDAFEKDQEKIKKEFIRARLQSNDSGFVTFVFHQNERKRYLGDIQDFQNYLIEFSKEKYNEISNNGVCSLCKNETVVFGNASPLTFYSLDKPGYIASGMSKEGGYKNFPVCFDCVLKLEAGSAYMQECMNFTLAGMKYYLLPVFISQDKELVNEVMQIYDVFHLETKGKVSIQQGNRISSDEHDILSKMQELNDAVSLKFLFYVEQNAKFTIQLLMEDIFPSRLRRLFTVKKAVEDHTIFKDIKFSAKKIANLEYNFAVLRKFFPTIKPFLEIVNQIFKGETVNQDYIFHLIMERVRSNVSEGKYLKIDVLQAFICLLFLTELQVFKRTGGVRIKMEESQYLDTDGDVQSKVDDFFSEFAETIDSNAKKAIFLTGVLTQHLLAIQKEERGATPFRVKLKGLKMKENDIKGLLPDIIQKLEEYDKNYYKQLESVISKYFLQVGSNWGMSIDEINFYFVLGMNLNDAKTATGKEIFKAGPENSKQGGKN